MEQGFRMPGDSPLPLYHFLEYCYDSAQRVLFHRGTPINLTPKVVDTLHALLQHHGRIVEKAELMRLVWPGCTVEESGLARNISVLRKALGDDADACIETIPRRGYRFIAPITISSAV
jgi:DNA-binding winged helix-turn-helix (wHTH) protein